MNPSRPPFPSRYRAALALLPSFLLLGGAGGCGPRGEGSRSGDAWAQEAAGVRPAAPAPGAQTGGEASALLPGGDTQDPSGQGVEASRTTAIVRAAERVAPAVVSVNVLRQELIRATSLWEEMFLPPGGSRRSAGYGSGIVFDAGGHILTNDHVVRGAQEIRVTFPDGRDLPARLVGSDGLTDVAVLEVEGDNLPVAPLGSSQGLMIGEWSIAIGNPFAYLLSNSEPSVTAGVISAVGRHIIPSGDGQGFYLGMIQTDASINPGNSGGPLVNALGEVIGVNTSIFSRSGGSEGLGFAIPIDRALRVAADLIQFGEVRRAWTGVEVDAVEADEWGRSRGVRVARAAPGSPAAEVGLSPGDHLLRANGRPLTTPLDFEAVLLDLRAGDPVELEVEGRRRPLRVVAETLPTSRAERVQILENLEVITVTPEVRAERGLRSEAGALVAGIAPELSQSLRLREGDVIFGINNTPIRTAEDAAQAFRALRAGMRVRIYFERSGAQGFQEFVVR